MQAAAPAPNVFRVEAFRRYFTGQTLSYAGDSLRALVLPLLVYQLTGSSAATAFAYFFEYVPMGAAALLSGSFADRRDRRRLMIGCDLVRSIVLVALALLGLAHALSAASIYAGTAVLSVAAGLFDAGQASSVPVLVGKSNATQAMASLFGAQRGSALIGPTLGGYLLETLGAVPALLITAFTYVASQVSLASLQSLGPETVTPLPSLAGIAADVRLGFRTLLNDGVARFVWYYLLVSNAVGMVFVVLLIPLFKADLHATDRDTGIAFGIMAAGSILGSMFAARTASRWPFGPAFAAGQLAEAVAVIPLVFAHSIWIAAISWAAAMAGTQFKSAQATGWRLRISSADTVGRVFGAVRVLSLGGMIIGIVAATYCATFAAPRAILIVCGVLYVALSFGLLTYRPLMREAR